jgi:hypothetical protein
LPWRLSPEQELFLADVRDLGGLAMCVKGWRELDEALREAGYAMKDMPLFEGSIPAPHGAGKKDCRREPEGVSIMRKELFAILHRMETMLKASIEEGRAFPPGFPGIRGCIEQYKEFLGLPSSLATGEDMERYASRGGRL